MCIFQNAGNGTPSVPIWSGCDLLRYNSTCSFCYTMLHMSSTEPLLHLPGHVHAYERSNRFYNYSTYPC